MSDATLEALALLAVCLLAAAVFIGVVFGVTLGLVFAIGKWWAFGIAFGGLLIFVLARFFYLFREDARRIGR